MKCLHGGGYEMFTRGRGGYEMFTTESVVITDKFLASKQVPLMTSVKPNGFDNESIAFDTVTL